MHSSISSRHALWLPAALGAAFFIALGGMKILNPYSVGWLMRGLVDPPTYQLGWEFFRNTPLLQFPLGANPDYGMALGSSIVFSDSLPLFALPFKLLNSWLPETFQYFGLWILTCFVLQAVFAFLLLSRFIDNKWLLILGTSLMLLMPAYLMRTTIHMVLAGQWILLAGFYLYFSRLFRGGAWVGLLVLAALIHAYLLVMLGAIWAADLLQRLLKREQGLAKCVLRIVLGIVPVVLVMWLLGYFMLGSSPAVNDSYGRMNLLTLFDSRGDWSRLLPYPKIDFWDSDGFAYFGAGLLGMLLLAMLLVIRFKGRISNWFTLLPLVLMSLFLTVIAITNYVKFGDFVLLSFDLPDIMVKVYQVFRSPGRLFWPVYYILCVAVLVVVCRCLKPAQAMPVMVLALVVQAYDISTALVRIHAYFTQEPGWASPLQSPAWREIAGRYNKVFYVPPQNIAPDFIALSDFAASNNMSINIGYFARVDALREKSHREELVSSALSGDFDSRAIYVFMTNDIWESAISKIGIEDQAGVLDGMKLILPSVRNCSDCKLEGFSERIWGYWPASQLPSLVGELRGGRLVARAGVPGYLSYGPYTQIPAGQIEFSVTYSSSADEDVEVGVWDVVSNAASANHILASGRLSGTVGQERTLTGRLRLDQAKPQSEIRTFSHGTHDVQLIRVELKRIETFPAEVH